MTAPSLTPDAALTEEEVALIKSAAEKQAAAYARMLEIGLGVGGLGAEHPEMFEDMLAWADASADGHHADTVLALLADRARLTERLAEVEAEVGQVALARNAAYRRRDEERAAKEGNIRALSTAITRAEAAEARETALREAVEALHSRRAGPVVEHDCIEGDCEHITVDDYDGPYPAPECPRLADAVCAHCADQTDPGDGWEHMIRPAAYWPCATIRALAEHATPSDAPQGEQHEPPCCCHKEMENGVGCCYCEGEGPCNHDDPAPVSADTGLSILSDRLAAVERERGEAQSAAYLKDQEAEGFREMARSSAAANLALLSTQSEIRQRAEIAEAERDDLRSVVEHLRAIVAAVEAELDFLSSDGPRVEDDDIRLGADVVIRRVRARLAARAEQAGTRRMRTVAEHEQGEEGGR